VSLTEDLREVQFGSYSDVFKKFNALSAKYGNLSADRLISAFTRATGVSYERNDPYIQNRRVKQIATLPVDYSKDKVSEMLVNASTNEQPLRAVEHALEVTAYPLFHLRKVYQDLLTYHSYTAPEFSDREDAKKDDFWREWKLIEKLRKAMFPASEAHRIVGQCCQEGKVFYYPRYRVDKPHNKVDHAFMQQLPSDWTKIVGFNNKSKYTLAFNLMYFLQPGTDYRQFGSLFEPFMEDFSTVLAPPKGVGKTVVYAAKAAPDLAKFKQMSAERDLFGDPEVYYQNGRWFYWVTLPVDEVFTFEIDDVATNVISPFTGLFLNMIQLAQYEQIQLELTQNPLISLVTGEIPYREDKNADTSDPYKLSPTGRAYFETLWYQMLSANNTSGIGIYFAPVENLELHQLAEAPSAMEISSNGYGYTMAKAGIAGIIPTSGDPKAGVAQISLQIESKFAQPVYRCFERMMEVIFEKMGLKYDWRFRMFGDIATDKQTLDSVRSEMTLGLSQSMLIYNALYDRSIFDDLSVSAALLESGLFDLRRPLMTSYSGKFDSKQQNDANDLDGAAKKVINPGGRPESEEITSEGNEKDADNPVDYDDE
jgi:hypothetical protein